MRFVIVVVFVLAASLAWAGDPTTQVVGVGLTQPQWEPAKEVELKWLQAPGEATLVSSQDFFDQAILSECADDFYCDDLRPIVAVEWWGGYWNYGTTLLTYVDHFVIRFYDDVPGPPFSHPGNLLYEEDCYVYSETYEDGTEPNTLFYHYYQDLDVEFEQVPGNIYWISVQAYYTYEGGGQWGWRLSDDHWNDVAAFRSVYFMGDDNWHPATEVWGAEYDLAFALYVPVINPVEAATWSGIKALYR